MNPDKEFCILSWNTHKDSLPDLVELVIAVNFFLYGKYSREIADSAMVTWVNPGFSQYLLEGRKEWNI